MKVTLRTDAAPRAWHRCLAEKLAGEGHALRVERLPACPRVPWSLALLLAAERPIYGVTSRLMAAAPLDSSRPGPRRSRGETIDDGPSDLVLEPRFDGVVGEGGLVAALLARRAPLVEIHDVSDDTPRLLATGLPAVERPDVLASALDMVLVRTIQLFVKAVRDARREGSPPILSQPIGASLTASPTTFFARTLKTKVARRIAASRGTGADWRIAVSRGEISDIASANDLDSNRFALLPRDDGSFQADPFPIAHDGRTCIFYEDFPYATRKGVIAMVELDATGVASSPPRRVLEQPVHLSYPHVLAHEGSVYMLPEMSGARRVQLFRADPFPDRWVADRILLEGVVLGDATLIRHDDRWWMFATQSGDRGSSWDALCLFHAPDLFGPWTPHAGNPVLIDAGAARPAGAMWHEDGALMRVAQDCRGGYGAGVAICRVDRLDPDDYAQTRLTRLGPPAGFGADRIHTLNRAGDLRTIDIHCTRQR